MQSICSRFSSLAKNIHLVFFALFAAFETLIIRNVALYSDDYYYASFFYNGFDYFLSENKVHYLKTNGRAFVHFLDELLLANGTIWMWKVFSVLCLCGIVWLAALIASSAHKNGIKTNEFRVSLIVISACVSAIPIGAANQTLYWATGFMNYVFPLFLTLALYYFTERALHLERFSTWLVPLAFFACTTTEQNAFASLCIVVFAIGRLLWARKRTSFKLVLMFIFGALGFAILFAAPGNMVRQTFYPDFYALSFADKILNNLRRLIPLVFGRNGALIALALFFSSSAFYFTVVLVKRARPILSLVNALSAVICLAIFRIGIYVNALYVISVIFVILSFIIDSVYFLIFFIKKREAAPLFFTVMSVGLQAAMLISPEMGPRTVIASVVLISVSTAFLVSQASKTLAEADTQKVKVRPSCAILAFSIPLCIASRSGVLVSALVALLCVAMVISKYFKAFRTVAPLCAVLIAMVFSLDMLKSSVVGYGENMTIYRENQNAISEYIEAGNSEKVLKLKYLKNDTYKYTMPYDSTYHLYWYKIVNRLDTNITLIFE